ncbi:MAG: hypothetical protein PHZ26_03470 [Candidatus Gracilibacteria bacterium]|nr:hypothetical protein [Candidatus Gracilibacteria bacterium]MDD2908786.1 hypothetical protein [Candidatus Gracilibacteria bacterium]
MNKLVNKKIIAIIISLVVILGLLGFYFKDNLDSIISPKTNSGAVDELITSNYSKDFHNLDLRSKKLGDMPNLCDMVEGTHYVDDIWAIDLADNGIEDISEDLSCFKNLSELYLSFNKIQEIKNLDELSFLKKLDLGNNEIKEISGLDKLVSLVDLHLGYNQIQTTSGLENLINLTSLQLQSNKLEDISNLSNLSKLETLKMEFNKLDNTDIKVIANLKNLKIITVGENTKIDKKTIDKLNEISRQNMK